MSLILPTHEQHWPTLMMPHRTEEFVRDGHPPTWARATAAIMVTGQQVYDAVTKAMAARNLKDIHPRYFIGTADHETGMCVNEWDTEVATANCVPGFVSVGLNQIGEEEARRYGYTLADMVDLDKNIDCMVRMAADNLKGLLTAANAAKSTGQASSFDYTDPKGKTWENGGLRAYLAIAHNHGMGFAHQTISGYGLDWARYKVRNGPGRSWQDPIVMHNYGEDCVTGGAHWPATVQD